MILSKIASVVFYLVIFCLTFFFAFLRKKTDKKIFGFLCILIPAICIALRFGVGTDSAAYVQMFNDISTEDPSMSLARIETFSMEPTAVFLIKILHHFAYGYFAYFFAYSLLTFSFLYIFSRKLDSRNWWLIFGSVVMLMTPYCINGMRQAAAVSVFSVLLVNVLQKPRNLLTNALLLLLTFSLHFTAILLVPVLIVVLLAKRFSLKKCAAAIIVFSFITLLVFPKVISFLLASGLMPYKYADTLASYDGSLVNFDFLIFFALSVLLLLTRKFSEPSEEKLNDFTTVVILCNLFYAGLGFYSAYIGRMSDYFWPMATFGIWLGIDRFKDSPILKRVFYVTALACYFILVYFVMGNSEIIPFRFLS